jgi:hypothetical protein
MRVAERVPTAEAHQGILRELHCLLRGAEGIPGVQNAVQELRVGVSGMRALANCMRS